MPRYDYSCRSCDFVFERTHGCEQKPKFSCPSCGSRSTFKMVSMFNMAVHETRARTAVIDHVSRERDCRQALERDYGIEKITPAPGVSIGQVYNEIKKQGSFTRDKMQVKKAMDDEKLRRKQRDWKISALKRTPERAKIRKDMKAKEEHQKCKIAL